MKIRKIAACLLVTLTAVSCSSAKNSGTKNNNNPRKIAITDSSDIYRKSVLPMPQDIRTITSLLSDTETGRILVAGRDSSGAMKCAVTDSDFSMYHAVDLRMDDIAADSTVLLDFCGEKFFAVTSTAGESGFSCRLSIRGMDGSIVSDSVIDTGGAAISSLVCTENGIFTGTGEICMALDDSGNILRTSDSGISSVIRLSDGKIAGISSGKGNILIRELDTATLEFSGPETELPENISGLFSGGSGDYVGFFANNSAVYGLKSDSSIERKIDLSASGLSGITGICPISGGDFIALDGGKLVRLSVSDTAEFGDIREITLAVTSPSDSLPLTISEFNAGSTRFRIKLEDYSEGMEYSIQGQEMAFDNLQLDVISGKSPDMVYLAPNETDLLAGKGAFADLYGFMDSDRTFSRDAFLANYLETCEMDGHFYSIEPTFMIETIAAKKKYVAAPDWTPDDFRSAYGAMPDGMELFESANNNRAVLSILTGSGSLFIDNSGLTCSFNSGEFADILEFSAQFPDVDEYDFEQKSCRNDTALLSNMYITSFRDINRQVQGTFGGEEVTFAGFPTNSGNGSKMLLGKRFSIMADSPDKDGAWEFIRSILDFQCRTPVSDGISVTEKGLALVAEDALGKPYFVEDSGERYYYDETFTDWSIGQEIMISPMTKAEQERYLEFVRSIKDVTTSGSTSEISAVIDEETDAFFAGECTSAQAAEMIQNRILIMLSEAE